MVVDGDHFLISVRFREQRNKNNMIPPMVGPALQASYGIAPRNTTARDHLPESVAGTTVFDPTPRWVWQLGVHQGIPARPDPNSGGRNQCHPMVHGGRGKHPALPLRYHLPGQLHIRWPIQGGASIPPCTPSTIIRCTWHPGAGIIVTLPATVIQAGLYSGAWGHLGGSKLPADFILLTSSLITLHSET